MDIYPLAEPTSPKKIDDSSGHLNKYGILCLIGEINKHECLFNLSSSEEKELAWNEIQKHLEHMDVKRSTVANIKMTWHDLVTKYNEWKVNPQSNSSHHVFFEKMKVLEEKKNVLGHNDLKDLHDVQRGTEVKEESLTPAEALEELKLPKPLPFTFAVIESVKMATYLRSGPINDEYDVDRAVRHPTLGIVRDNMAQRGFHCLEDVDVLPTWIRLLEIHEMGKTCEFKSKTGRDILEKLAFVDQKPVKMARRIYQRYNPETRKFAYMTPVAKREERSRLAAAKALEPEVADNQNLFWFYCLAIIGLAIVYWFLNTETPAVMGFQY